MRVAGDWLDQLFLERDFCNVCGRLQRVVLEHLANRRAGLGLLLAGPMIYFGLQRLLSTVTTGNTKQPGTHTATRNPATKKKTRMAAPACPALPKKLGSLSDVLKERMPDSPEAMNSARSASRRFSLRGMTNKLMSKVIGGSSDDAASWDASKLPASFFDLECADSKGNPFPLQEIRGNVVLCVNVASF